MLPSTTALTVLAAALLLMFMLPAPADAEAGSAACSDVQLGEPEAEFFGPLSSLSHDPLGLLVLQPPPDAAAILPDGGARLSLTTQVTSDRRLEQARGVREHYHYELTGATADYRRRLGEGELGVQLPLYHRGATNLAPLIDGFHELFGFRDRRTPDFPEGGYAYSIEASGGTVYAGNSLGLALGDLSLRYKQPLWEASDGRAVLSGRVAVKAPTGRAAQAAGSGGWDMGAGLLWQQRLGRRWQAYANCDYIRTGAPAWDNARRQDVVSYLGAVEYAIARDLTATAQFQAANNPLTLGNSESDEDCGELAVGLQGRLGSGERWGAWLREDILGDTGPDVSFGASVGWEW